VLTTAHVPGRSPLHRAPAGAKLVVLGVGLLVLGLVRTPAVVAVGAATVLVAAAVSGLPWRVRWDLVRPALVLGVLVGALQWWLAGPVVAAVTAGWLVVAVVAAGLVTATTPMQDLLDAVVVAVRPLRRAGVDPDRVALTLALAVSSVPVVTRLAGEVREARRARGAERSVRALAVPLVIRTVRHADRLGEALRARGLDDD
jgi:biotin transport system permease protein